MKSSTIDSFTQQIDRLGAVLQEADAVLIGAGAGLSAAAGLTYSGERFQKHFADFAAKYRICDMYSGGFYPFPTPEDSRLHTTCPAAMCCTPWGQLYAGR